MPVRFRLRLWCRTFELVSSGESCRFLVDSLRTLAGMEKGCASAQRGTRGRKMIYLLPPLSLPSFFLPGRIVPFRLFASRTDMFVQLLATSEPLQTPLATIAHTQLQLLLQHSLSLLSSPHCTFFCFFFFLPPFTEFGSTRLRQDPRRVLTEWNITLFDAPADRD